MPRHVWVLGFVTAGCLAGAIGLALPILMMLAFDAALDVSVYDPSTGTDPYWHQERLRVWFVEGWPRSASASASPPPSPGGARARPERCGQSSLPLPAGSGRT